MASSQREVLARLIEANSTTVVSVLRGVSGSALDALIGARMLEQLVGDVLQALVIEARESGSTWQQVANVMQTTRQAAYQRFGRAGIKEEEMTEIAEAEAKAVALLDDYMTQRWEAVRRDFDDRMLAGLSEEMLVQTSSSIREQYGEFISSAEPSTKSAGGYAVVDIPLKFERGELKFRVSIDADGKIGGLFLLNPAVA